MAPALKPATVPICDACWNLGSHHEPVRLKNPQEEVCVDCQQPTLSGIYVRRMIEALKGPDHAVHHQGTRPRHRQ